MEKLITRVENESAFELGHITISGGVRYLARPADIVRALHRHRRGVSGDTAGFQQFYPKDKHRCSAHCSRMGHQFWVITERGSLHDATTVLLPAEYGQYKQLGISPRRVVVHKYRRYRRQLRPRDAGPVIVFAGLMLAVAAKWLGFW